MSVIISIKSYLFPYYYRLIRYYDYLLGKIEQKKGLDFMKHATPEELGLSRDKSSGYEGVTSKKIKKVFKHFTITNQDSIIDLGCGKGKALYEMSKFSFKKIDGVEISQNLSNIAKSNIEKLNIKNIEIFNMDAALFRNLDNYNYIYFFNPFPSVVFKEVMNNIEKSLISKPRTITIIYLLPKSHKEIIKSGVFQKCLEQKNVIVYRNNN